MNQVGKKVNAGQAETVQVPSTPTRTEVLNAIPAEL